MMLTEVSYFRQGIWISKRSWEAGAVYTVFVVDVVYKKKLNRNNWKFLLMGSQIPNCKCRKEKTQFHSK